MKKDRKIQKEIERQKKIDKMNEKEMQEKMAKRKHNLSIIWKIWWIGLIIIFIIVAIQTIMVRFF